jgi:hypothetical protein
MGVMRLLAMAVIAASTPPILSPATARTSQPSSCASTCVAPAAAAAWPTSTNLHASSVVIAHALQVLAIEHGQSAAPRLLRRPL